MKVTLTHPGAIDYTLHTPGVRVLVEGAPGPAVPPPLDPDLPPGTDVEPPPVTPPPPTGFDTLIDGCLVEAWANIDPFGQPDYAQLGTLGFEFKWETPVAGFERHGKSCCRWTCGVWLLGDIEFRVLMKSSGAIELGDEVIWADDREADPGSGYIEKQEFARTLKNPGTLLQILTRFEGSMGGCTVEWRFAGEEEYKPLASVFYHPPADWQTRLKDFTPAPPEPLPYVVPDEAYRSPELTGRLFPDDSPWNTPVDQEPVDPLSDAIIARLGAAHLHPVFGVGAGIPFEVVPDGTPKSTVVFQYADESDAGPYPIPPKPTLESGGGDGHWIGVHGGKLYELFYVSKQGNQWHAGSGAIFDLATGQRVSGVNPGWTSADAAGLPVLPGLVRPDELEINHALRITVGKTRRGFVAPGTHFTGLDVPENHAENLPPMGARFRLKSTVDEAAFPASVRPILKALKKYGAFISDNGSPSFIGLCGVPHAAWSDNELGAMKSIKASEFEVCKMGPITTQVP